MGISLVELGSYQVNGSQDAAAKEHLEVEDRDDYKDDDRVQVPTFQTPHEPCCQVRIARHSFFIILESIG